MGQRLELGNTGGVGGQRYRIAGSLALRVKQRANLQDTIGRLIRAISPPNAIYVVE